MKIILAQPAILRFSWELEVLLTNIKQFGDFDVILLFTQNDDTVPQHLANKYGVQCFVYGDDRSDKRYPPSVRPYLLWKYLSGDSSREQEQYFYIDSDIIFREWPDFSSVSNDASSVVGSDCSGYIDYDYIMSCQHGEEIAKHMASVCGISIEQMRGVPGIGAQLILNKPTAKFWERSYYDTLRLYDYFNTVDSNIQKWTAEMWAQLWGWVREDKHIVMPKELDFCRPTDNIKMWDMVKIMHNAGVVGSGEMFYKGMYVDHTPFGEDFSYVRRDKVSRKYVEAIKNVIL